MGRARLFMVARSEQTVLPFRSHSSSPISSWRESVPGALGRPAAPARRGVYVRTDSAQRGEKCCRYRIYCGKIMLLKLGHLVSYLVYLIGQ